MTVTVALAGDTMLGRGVGRALATTPPEDLVAPEVRAALGEADLIVLNLECCISGRGRPWDAPGKPFFFRAPPRAVELLAPSRRRSPFEGLLRPADAGRRGLAAPSRRPGTKPTEGG